MLIHGDCLDKLKELPDNSVDSIVCDPPYELGFMGKAWDNTGIAYNKEMWAECLRVLKPGGHLLAFSGTRTYHRMTVAIEDAGFEIRDMVEWVYGSGFPKSFNISKAIEGQLTQGSSSWNNWHKLSGELGEAKSQGSNGLVKLNAKQGNRPEQYASHGTLKLEATTEEAKKWEGWGTALKPAHEPICLARKPIIGTVAQNVLTYGTGGLNIDKSRVFNEGEEQCTNKKDIGCLDGQKMELESTSSNIEQCGKNTMARYPEDMKFTTSTETNQTIELKTSNSLSQANTDKSTLENTQPKKKNLKPEEYNKESATRDESKTQNDMLNGSNGNTQGRFPANLLHDGSDEVVREFPNTKGDNRTSKSTYDKGIWGNAKPVESTALYSDEGSAARYFKSFKEEGGQQ